MTFRQIHTNRNFYKYSFFPVAIVQWIALPESVVSLQDLEQLKPLSSLWANCNMWWINTRGLVADVSINYNTTQLSTCKAKRGQRPRVRSTPIDNTYVQVNNFLFTWLTNHLQKVVQHGAAQPQLNPVSMPIFVFSHRSRDTNSSRKNFPKLREWLLIDLFRIQILKNIFLNSLHAIRR